MGSWCDRITNELLIIDISNLNNPRLLTIYDEQSFGSQSTDCELTIKDYRLI
jgi:hypothetical protein